jgi:hypothetical protein
MLADGHTTRAEAQKAAAGTSNDLESLIEKVPATFKSRQPPSRAEEDGIRRRLALSKIRRGKEEPADDQPGSWRPAHVPPPLRSGSHLLRIGTCSEVSGKEARSKELAALAFTGRRTKLSGLALLFRVRSLERFFPLTVR